MEVFTYVVVLECAAAIVTGIGCRLVQLRHRRAGWYIALCGAFLITAFEMYWENRSLLFHPADWSDNKRSLEGFLFEFFFVMVLGLIPGSLVVRHYRKTYKMSER